MNLLTAGAWGTAGGGGWWQRRRQRAVVLQPASAAHVSLGLSAARAMERTPPWRSRVEAAWLASAAGRAPAQGDTTTQGGERLRAGGGPVSHQRLSPPGRAAATLHLTTENSAGLAALGQPCTRMCTPAWPWRSILFPWLACDQRAPERGCAEQSPATAGGRIAGRWQCRGAAGPPKQATQSLEAA